MADIFLSYAKEDREVARKLSGLLVSAGWTVWWDRRIPAGGSWRKMLETALRDMRCMVVLWSSHSIESDWVKEEAEEARAAKKLLPVIIEAVNPPVGFRTIQAADLTDWDGVGESLGVRQLIADLELCIGKPAQRAAGDSTPRLPPRRGVDATRSEIRSFGSIAAAPSAGRATASMREGPKIKVTRWQLAAATGVVLVLTLGVLLQWRARDPGNEIVTPMEPMDLREDAASNPSVSRAASIPKSPPAPKLVSLTVDANKKTLTPRESIDLRAIGRYSDGSKRDLSGGVAWVSSDASVAAVNSRGELEALRAGKVEIMIRSDGVTSAPLRLVVTEPPKKIAVDSEEPRRPDHVPVKTPVEVKIAKETRPVEPRFTAEQLRSKIASYISRAKKFRVQGNYGAALAELATARAADPESAEVRSEIEQTRRACQAEKILGRKGLDC